MKIGKENAMKTSRKTTVRIAGYDRPVEAVTAEWLTSRGRNGRRHVEVLGWKRLAVIFAAAKPGSDIRKAIDAEARRCGYTPKTILALNADDRAISMRKAVRIARSMGVRGIEVRRSPIDPSCWEVSTAHQTEAHEPMTEAAWRTLMADWRD